jgi:hypothetical protein
MTRHRTVVVINPVAGVVVAACEATPLLVCAADVSTPENSEMAIARDEVPTEWVNVTVSAPALPEGAQAVRKAWLLTVSCRCVSGV